MPLNGSIHVWKPSSSCFKKFHQSVVCVCVSLCMCASVCVYVGTCIFVFSSCLSLLCLSHMDFHFLSRLWLIGFREATRASPCLWTRTSDVWCFISSPASWLIINSSSEFWHVQINNHSVKMNTVTFVPTRCSEKKGCGAQECVSSRLNETSKNGCFCGCIDTFPSARLGCQLTVV